MEYFRFDVELQFDDQRINPEYFLDALQTLSTAAS